MGVLDRQSLRGTVRNRRIGRSRLELRDRRDVVRPGARDRRRPERGLGATAPRPSPHPPRHGVGRVLARAVDSAAAAARAVALLLALPLVALSLLARPAELVRRAGEAPGRLRATSRRLRLEARDPATFLGRLRATVRLLSWFVAEELADMRDGVPTAERVRHDLRAGGRTALHGVGGLLGLRPGRAANAGDRLLDAARLGFVLGVIGVGLFVATYNGFEELKQGDALAVQTLTVTGLDRVPEGSVHGRLGVALGDNLLDLDPAALALAVQGLPWVDAAEVVLDLPSRTVEVRVVERRPLFVLAGPRLLFVDERGHAFKEREPGEPGDLPLLTGVPFGADGAPVPEDLAAAAAGALEVARALGGGRALVPATVSEIAWSRDGGWTVVTRAGLPVRLGDRDFAARLRRVERAVQSGQLPLDAYASIDGGLRDRLVAVPLPAPTARKAVEQVVLQQAVPSRERARLLHLQRVELDLDPVFFEDAGDANL